MVLKCSLQLMSMLYQVGVTENDLIEKSDYTSQPLQSKGFQRPTLHNNIGLERKLLNIFLLSLWNTKYLLYTLYLLVSP